MDFGQMTISEIKVWLAKSERSLIADHLPYLEVDQRSGVQKLLKQWQQQEATYQQQLVHWEELTQEEQALRAQGFTHICGVDEVGRGPLAGPVVAAAIILPADFYLLGINDSKKLNGRQREQFAARLLEESVAYSIVYRDAQEIDRFNIYQATLQAMTEAVSTLKVKPDYLLVDALNLASLEVPQKALIKGDARSLSIAAASIIAKVSRDQYMTAMAEQYPQYGFERHMGYGTKEHLQAIERYGLTPLHRRSFAPNQLSISM